MKAKIDLITGFLGAGKTTFLKRYAVWLKQHGEKLIIVENEFGQAGVDAALLEVTGVEITQLTGGCICCGQKVNFHDLLLKLADHYDRILVEPSGIYTLEDFYEICESPPVAARLELNTIITVLDSQNLDSLSDSEQQILYSQCAGAGFILISKTDGAGQEKVMRQAEEYLKSLYASRGNHDSLSRQRLAAMPWEQLPESFFKDLAGGHYIRNRVNLKKQDHSTLFQSTTICPVFADSEQLHTFIRTAMSGRYGKVIRLKGFLTLADNSGREINCTSKEWHAVPVKLPPDTEPGINLIGREINRRLIKAELKEKQIRV